MLSGGFDPSEQNYNGSSGSYEQNFICFISLIIHWLKQSLSHSDKSLPACTPSHQHYGLFPTRVMGVPGLGTPRHSAIPSSLHFGSGSTEQWPHEDTGSTGKSFLPPSAGPAWNSWVVSLCRSARIFLL